MKKKSINNLLNCFLIALLPSLSFAQNGLLWTTPLPISTLAFGTASPRLTLLPDGNPAAVWGSQTKIWFSKMENGVFLAPKEIITGGIVPGLYDFGGLDIASSGTHIFVVFERFQQGIFCVRSEDAGNTWSAPVTVFTNATGRGSTISSVAVDALGNPMVSFLYQLSNETNANVQLVRSLDAGLTFSVITNASTPAGGDFVCECCYQDILPTGGDTVFVAFRNNQTNLRDTWVTRSTDGGTVFDAACDVDAIDWVVNACPFSGPRLMQIKNDSLFSVWMAKTSAGLRVFGSTLQGGSMVKGWEFALPPTTAANLYNQNHPDVAGNQDTIAMVWEESGFSGSLGQEIICAFSTTGTVGLSGNRNNVSMASSSQKFPQLAYKNGVFHLIYSDPIKGVVYRAGTVVAPNAIHDITNANLQIMPNPVEDILHFESNIEQGKVMVFSTLGVLLQKEKFIGKKNRIVVGDLVSGFYFLKMVNKKGQIVDIQSFIKN
jgi:Secretion system C-terminal sorting domain